MVIPVYYTMVIPQCAILKLFVTDSTGVTLRLLRHKESPSGTAFQEINPLYLEMPCKKALYVLMYRHLLLSLSKRSTQISCGPSFHTKNTHSNIYPRSGAYGFGLDIDDQSRGAIHGNYTLLAIISLKVL